MAPRGCSTPIPPRSATGRRIGAASTPPRRLHRPSREPKTAKPHPMRAGLDAGTTLPRPSGMVGALIWAPVPSWLPLRQMQADILALLGVNMHLGFRLELFLFAGFPVFHFGNLHFPRDHIIGGAGWNALGKFSAMVGQQFPGWAVLSGGTHLHPDPVERAVVRPIGGPENKSVVFLEDLPMGERQRQTAKKRQDQPGEIRGPRPISNRYRLPLRHRHHRRRDLPPGSVRA